MKTTNELPVADCQLSIENRKSSRQMFQIRNLKSEIANGFTLVELLVVIAIIGILAAFIFPVVGVVKRHQYIQNAQAEMGQLGSAIAAYKDAFGFYPPDNATNPMVNQLYYELTGTTNSNGTFRTLDGTAQITSAQVTSTFGVGGFVNCSKPGSNEESGGGKNFIQGLKPNQTATLSPNGVPITVFVTSVGGPDGNYNPLGVAGVNPWRYKSSGTLTNNPGAYELWVQLSIAGKKYLVCNWNNQQQVNNPLP
jgi:prepilin-type N-terminal cleavage/methylation domain-containing protein